MLGVWQQANTFKYRQQWVGGRDSIPKANSVDYQTQLYSQYLQCFPPE